MFFSLMEWILIAIIIAAIFGVIDLTKARGKAKELFQKASPYIKQALDKIKEKIDNKKQ